MPEIEMNGIYEHYKGGTYTVAGLAYHHDDHKPWVIYTSRGWLWIRPLEEFTGYTKDGKKRFRYVGPAHRPVR